MHKIVITIHRKEIDFVRNILSQLGIIDVFAERQEKLVVMEWRNLYKFTKTFALHDVCPFSLHKERKKNFINGFLNHKRTVALQRYLSIIEENEGVGLNQLPRIAKRDQASVHIVIFKRLKEFTNIYGIGRRNNPYRIHLSEYGKEFLQTIRKLEEWR